TSSVTGQSRRSDRVPITSDHPPRADLVAKGPQAVAPITSWQAWRLEERKSDRQPYPGRRPTIALACASIETRPLASIGTCSRTRDLSCVTSAVALVVSIGARLGAAIVVDQYSSQSY